MNSSDPYTLDLPLLGGVVRAQRLVVPPEVVMRLRTYRQACRLAWKLRVIRGMTQRTLAEHAGLYPSHTSDYFSVHEHKRELPARHIAAVERVVGNTVITQWLAQQTKLTILEEIQAHRRAALHKVRDLKVLLRKVARVARLPALAHRRVPVRLALQSRMSRGHTMARGCRRWNRCHQRPTRPSTPQRLIEL